jgi:ArsR family transcriptional regulator
MVKNMPGDDIAPASPKGPLPPALLASVADRFRVLGSASRLQVLSALMEGPLGMAELIAATGLEQSNLSRHVRELERAGCVERRRSGRTVEVAISDPTLMTLCDLVCGTLRDRAEAEHARLTARG